MIRQPSFPFGAEPVVVRAGLPEQPPEPVPRFTVPLPVNAPPVSPTFRGVERSTMPLVPATASRWAVMPPAAPLVLGAPRELRATIVDRPAAARLRRDAQLPPRPRGRLRWTPALGGMVFLAGFFAMQLGVIAFALHMRRPPPSPAAPIALLAVEPASASASEPRTAPACFEVVAGGEDVQVPRDSPPAAMAARARAERPAPASGVRAVAAATPAATAQPAATPSAEETRAQAPTVAGAPHRVFGTEER
jgi:hypothetical protein